MKRKVLISVLAIFVCLTLVGCGKKEETKGDNNGNNNGSGEKQATSKAPEGNGTKHEYFYDDGVLYQIVDDEEKPKQTDFVIDGLILVGNRHEYRDENGTETIIESLVKEGYKKKDLNSAFYLNEYIEFYIDTKYNGSNNDVKIITVPYKSITELESMSLSKLEELATENGGFVLNYETPDKNNHKYVGNAYVSIDSKEGKYLALFTYKGKLAYYIPMNLTKEPTE